MKEVDILEINGKDYIINKNIKNYYYCSNELDVKDCCVLKEVNGQYFALSDDELEEALALYKQDE